MKYLKTSKVKLNNVIKTKKKYNNKTLQSNQYKKLSSRTKNILNTTYKYTINYDTFITEIGKCKVNFKTYNHNKIDSSNPYKIISVSYFVLPNYGPITKGNKYLKGLNNLVKNANKYLPDYKIRIYCDNHGFKLLDNLLNNPRVEIFIYTMKKFLETNKKDNKKYHKGYIGTMMRFLPFFNYKNHNVDLVINLDIDNKLNFLTSILIQNEVHKYGFFYKWRACYNANNRMIRLGYIKYPVIASFISMNKSKLTLPNSILNDFFDTYLLKDDSRYMSYLYTIELDTLFIEGVHKEHNKEINKFMYGIDEYFLNYNVFNWLKSNKISITAFDLFYSLNQVINTLINYIKKLIKNNKDDTNKIVIKLFIHIQNLMLVLGYKYNAKLNQGNYKKIIISFREYLEKVKFDKYYYDNIKKNKKNKLSYIRTVNNILNFIKLNKQILEVKLQDYDCIKYNLEIYKYKLKHYKIITYKLNDYNCNFYTTKQFETKTNYTYL
jgi:hypothetical protein